MITPFFVLFFVFITGSAVDGFLLFRMFVRFFFVFCFFSSNYVFVILFVVVVVVVCLFVFVVVVGGLLSLFE